VARRAALVGAVLAALAVSAAPAAADWPVYGGDLANTRNAGAAGPMRAQLAGLAEAWRFDSPTGDFTGTPVVAGGVLVAGDYSGTVYALDAVTGKVRWSKNVGGPVNGSAAIDTAAPGGAAVFVPVATAGKPRLAALSLADGRARWSTVLTDQAQTSVYGSPTFWKGKVYIGTSGPNGDDSKARGTVVALDERTGAVRWRTFMVPPGRDGGLVWSTPAIDTATGRLYVGTGNAYHAPAADTTDAIVAMNASNGAILGHYQAIADDTFAADNPAGPDADFGSSPNLIRGPTGRALVGEGAKDGFYYALDRASMKFVWKRSLGPGSAIGGFLGSTAYDGKRVYGSNALTSQVGAIGVGGASQWSTVDGGTLDFSPLATANGAVYSANNAGTVTVRDAASGAELKTLSLGAPTFGGMSFTGRALYAAVGIGPPPPPGPQDQYGEGSIVAFGDTSHSGGGGNGGNGGNGGGGGQNGGGGTGTSRARIKLSVRPRAVRAGRRTVFRFTARARKRAVRGAVVRLAGHQARTNRKGVARIAARLRHGRHTARASKRGFRGGRVTVYAHRRQDS
jgi:polyvinyl alcohol dehydrogenase (cytochrome)